MKNSRSGAEATPSPAAAGHPGLGDAPRVPVLRFVLIRTVERRFLRWQWRATAIKDDGGWIDIFFYQPTIHDARQLLRAKYPGCVFTDEPAGRMH